MAELVVFRYLFEIRRFLEVLQARHILHGTLHLIGVSDATCTLRWGANPRDYLGEASKQSAGPESAILENTSAKSFTGSDFRTAG